MDDMDDLQIFICYSHKDAKWFDEKNERCLIPWLEDILHTRKIKLWYDRGGLKAGDQYRRELDAEIDRSQIALLLVSWNFLASDFILKTELPRIQARENQRQMIVIPVLLSPCDWKQYPQIEKYQILPGQRTPLVNYTQNDVEWEDAKDQILRAILARADQIRKVPTPPIPPPPPIPASVRPHWLRYALLGLILAAVVALAIWRPWVKTAAETRAVATPALSVSLVAATSQVVPEEVAKNTSPDQVKDIEDLAAGLAVGFFYEDFTDVKDVILQAQRLNIKLSDSELANTAKGNESEKDAIIERITGDISSTYGKRMGALLKTQYYSLGAGLWLAYASSKANNDYPNANGGVVIASAYMNDAVNAAKSVDMKLEIINEGDTIFKDILGLANKDTLVQNQLSDSLSRVIQWETKAVDELK